MRLRTLFFLLGGLLVLAWGILLSFTLNAKSPLLYVGEGVISFSLVILFYFYWKVIKPLHSIASGMDLLREQDFSSRLAPVGQAEADRIVEMFNRMMTQLKNERLRLREQNHFLDLLINVSPMGVIILTFDGQISMLNTAALRFLGYTSAEELMGKQLEELDTPLAEEVARLPKDTTDTIRLSDAKIYRCSRLSFVDHGFAHPFVLIESLTTEVVKAEKKAYEKVIRMIAHEVNNTTAGITSTLETVEDALETLEEETGDLREVMKVCVERCLGMSRFITNFANVVKIPEPSLEQVRLNDRVTACRMFMETICRERQITLHNELCAENPKVWMDTVLFEQVLVNIIKNAAESIGQGGDIYICTSALPMMLEIADTGKGISKEVETKLFSPFFSTKPHGQGIGLIFIREVLTRHGCTFSLRTYPDGLTRFRISFPERRSDLQGKDF
ncbi:ATP-binding protein [uncultured Bacteroides sp.]|uniref:sensor histidine kinase n=1 Tax=uncultured Bacteroides sp. TaxID=162156 RepID=UPI00280BCE80|nr:ATP-binding protein [uncultured Bacteroides sp.]